MAPVWLQRDVTITSLQSSIGIFIMVCRVQYWDIKSRYMDVLLFIKVGTFYELYQDDADTVCELLGWKLTVTGVGQCRQVGCPEVKMATAIPTLTAAGAPPLYCCCTCGVHTVTSVCW